MGIALIGIVIFYNLLPTELAPLEDRSRIIFNATVPLALSGALFSLWYCNQTMNIFSQIGIIMLIGLVARNGILIVEFANQRISAGMPLYSTGNVCVSSQKEHIGNSVTLV